MVFAVPKPIFVDLVLTPRDVLALAPSMKVITCEVISFGGRSAGPEC